MKPPFCKAVIENETSDGVWGRHFHFRRLNGEALFTTPVAKKGGWDEFVVEEVTTLFTS
jgi:hypothetical protein